MKKKILVIALVLVLAVSGVFAGVFGDNYKGASKNNTMGIGLNLGTNTGLGMKFGMGKFDVVANIGLDNFGFNPFCLAGDASVSYEVYDIDIKGPHHMPVTVGLGLNTTVVFAEKSLFKLGVMVPVGIEYTIPDFPMNFYLRLAPGIGFNFGSDDLVDFDFDAYIGALYVFDL